MQTAIAEPLPPVAILASESEFEFFEPKRVVISPLEMCMLSDVDDMFEDD